MWRDAHDAVEDMLTACTEVPAFTEDVDIATLRRDTLRLRAVERSLSILGEAAKRVPADLRERRPTRCPYAYEPLEPRAVELSRCSDGGASRP